MLAFFGGLLLPALASSSWNPLAWLAPVFGADPLRGATCRPARSGRWPSSTPWWPLVGLARGHAPVDAALGASRASSRWCCSGSYFIDDVYDRLIGRPGAGARPLLRHGDRHQGHRRGRQRRGPAGPGAAGGPAPGPDRLRPPVRLGIVLGTGGAAGLDGHRGPGREDPDDPRHRLPVPHRAGAAARRARPWSPRSSPRPSASALQRSGWCYAVGPARVARHAGPGRHHRGALPRRRRRVPDGEPARVGAVARASPGTSGVDGISVFLVLMAAVLFPLVLLGAGERRDPRAFVAWLLLLEAGCLGSFVVLDLILFFLFFELTLVPVYFVIAGWGFDRRAPRGDQVLRLHVPRLGLPAGRDRGPGLHPRAADRAGSPSTCWRSRTPTSG